MSSTYSIKTVQQIPVSIDQAWEFFSRPDNLKDITPDNLGFDIISKYHGSQMYPGQIIEYTVRPIMGIPLYWMTEITQVADKNILLMNNVLAPTGSGITSIISVKFRAG